MTWIPAEVEPPSRVDLPTGHHLRPIRESDIDIDYPAVMGSRERLWARYGEAWGWPPSTMTREQGQADLARHEAEIAVKETFNYAVRSGRSTGSVAGDPGTADNYSRRMRPLAPGEPAS